MQSFEYPFHLLGPSHKSRMAPPIILDGVRGVRAEAADGFNNLGDAHWERRRVSEALACYHQAVRLGADPAARAERRWMGWMMLGRFERAWRESDRLERLHRVRHGPAAHCHTWDGRPLDGRDVLVRCAHGLGDTIQFARYLPRLRARCRSLTLQAQRELWPVLQGLGADRIVASWETLPEDLEYNAEIEVMELPYAFRSTPADLPAAVPYLNAPPECATEARRAIGDEKRFKIGLVWASSSWYAARSVPLQLFEPLMRMEGVAVYNLQHGPERENFYSVVPHSAFRIPHCLQPSASSLQPSILETASMMLAMDLILTPDTLAAHLAGALGRPVWVMLLHHADWRWMDRREDSPWYPTMRLFRQPAAGDWAGVVRRVLAEIKNIFSNRSIQSSSPPFVL